MRKWNDTNYLIVLLTTLIIPAATNYVYVLQDCDATIRGRFPFICQLLKKCTRIFFFKNSVFETSIIKQRSDNSRTWACTAFSIIKFTWKMLIHMIWISSNKLITDLRAETERSFNFADFAGMFRVSKHSTPQLTRRP